MLLGVLILLRNPKKVTNQTFFTLVIFTVMWMISSFYTDNANIEQRLFWAKLAFMFPVLVTYSLSFLFRVFPTAVGFKSSIITASTLLAVAGLFLSISNLVVADIIVIVGGTAIEPGPLYPVYILIIVSLLILSLTSLFKNHKALDKIQLTQTRLVASGFVAGFVWVLVFSLLIPMIDSSLNTPKYAPVGTIFFVGAIGYAILRHKLFDIRLAIARAIGYFLSILSVAIVFAFLAFLAVNFLTDDDLKLPQSQQAILTLIAVALAFVFQPVKNFFDKLSNAFFYRDAYDPQEFFDELNKVLVSRVDVEPLLTGSAETIKKHLKTNFLTFYLRETQYIEKRYLGDNDQNFEEDDIEKISIHVSQIHKTLIVTDELEDEHAELSELLRRYDISAIARLVTTVKYDVAGVGYLILGPKRSGSPYSHGDVKVLEIVANELVIAIQNALRFEEIEEFNVTLQKKIDEATKKLRKTNEKLEEMDQTKDEFISMASHQLRTPLTSVKGYLSMVLEGDAGEIKPMQERLLSQAFTSSQRMVYLIADLLNVSRLRTGKFVIEKIRANLADIAEGEVAQLKETAASRSLELEYQKPDNFPDLMLDETKMRQVIMNFIDNAIYYTPSEGKITVELIDKDETVELMVHDTGMGVPKADQQHLFTKFYRAGNAKKARPDGTGLGLFMAKKVIIEQGGAIIFKSKEGEGSTFGFTLPKNKLLPKTEEPQPKKEE